MAVKVDIYSAHEGRESGAGLVLERVDKVVGSLVGRSKNWGIQRRTPQPTSVAMVAEKKKLQELKKKR